MQKYLCCDRKCSPEKELGSYAGRGGTQEINTREEAEKMRVG